MEECASLLVSIQRSRLLTSKPRTDSAHSFIYDFGGIRLRFIILPLSYEELEI